MSISFANYYHNLIGGALTNSKEEKIPKSVYIPKGLELAPSKIPGAGLGIFATKDFPKGHDFGVYKGKYLTPLEYYNENKELLYVWEIKDYRGNKNRPKGQKYDPYEAIGYVDGGVKKHSNFLRYVNHPRSMEEENLMSKQVGPDIHYVSTKPIKAGQELLINYGPSYSKLLIGTEDLPAKTPKTKRKK